MTIEQLPQSARLSFILLFPDFEREKTRELGLTNRNIWNILFCPLYVSLLHFYPSALWTILSIWSTAWI